MLPATLAAMARDKVLETMDSAQLVGTLAHISPVPSFQAYTPLDSQLALESKLIIRSGLTTKIENPDRKSIPNL